MDREPDLSSKPRTYAEYSLECEQDFDALPHSLAFEQVMNDHMTERVTAFESQVIVPLDIALLPPELSDTFYFPTRADLSDVKAILTEGPDDLWALTLKFSVNNRVYVVTSTQEGLLIQTDNSEGGSIDYRVERSIAPRLLAAFAVSSLDADTDKHQQLFKDNTLPTDGSGIKKQLLALGHLIGTTNSSTTAPLPFEYGDRAIIATYTETESMHTSGIGTSIDLAWELFDSSTEFSYVSHAVKDSDTGLNHKTTYVEVAANSASIDDFVLSKQVPDLFEDNELQPALTINRSDPRWQNIAMTFMSTIGPLMDEYKYLDTAS